jgi:hypothetical protein
MPDSESELTNSDRYHHADKSCMHGIADIDARLSTTCSADHRLVAQDSRRDFDFHCRGADAGRLGSTWIGGSGIDLWGNYFAIV